MWSASATANDGALAARRDRELRDEYIERIRLDMTADREALQNRSTYQDLQNTGNIRLIDDIDLRTSLANYHNRADANQSGRSGWTPTEDYRRTIRGVVPGDVQDLIRGNCPTTSELDGVPTGFPPCDLPGVGYEEIAILLEPLKTDHEFRRRLTYRHSELGVVIYLLDAQTAFADEVLSHIDKR